MAIPWINVKEFNSAINIRSREESKMCRTCNNKKRVVSSNNQLKYKCFNCDESNQ